MSAAFTYLSALVRGCQQGEKVNFLWVAVQCVLSLLRDDKLTAHLKLLWHLRLFLSKRRRALCCSITRVDPLTCIDDLTKTSCLKLVLIRVGRLSHIPLVTWFVTTLVGLCCTEPIASYGNYHTNEEKWCSFSNRAAYKQRYPTRCKATQHLVDRREPMNGSSLTGPWASHDRPTVPHAYAAAGSSH